MDKRETWERQVSRVQSGRLEKEETEDFLDDQDNEVIGAILETKVDVVNLDNLALVETL